MFFSKYLPCKRQDCIIKNKGFNINKSCREIGAYPLRTRLLSLDSVIASVYLMSVDLGWPFSQVVLGLSPGRIPCMRLIGWSVRPTWWPWTASRLWRSISEDDLYSGLVKYLIVSHTRVASHLARSDTPSITCVVARLSRSDTPTLLWRPSDQSQSSARAAHEARVSDARRC